MIKGLTVINDFLSKEEELELLSHLKLSTPIKTGGRNSIRRYGSKIPYNTSMISKDIPSYLSPLIDRIMAQSLLSERPDSLTINEYREGQGISPHIDNKRSGEVITVLSLMSPAIMLMKKEVSQHRIELLPRSLLRMAGESRWEWEHSILPVKETRLSIVFRKSTT